ncbi:hypothetical protein ACFQBU_12435 [Jhaorihella thermophila]
MQRVDGAFDVLGKDADRVVAGIAVARELDPVEVRGKSVLPRRGVDQGEESVALVPGRVGPSVGSSPHEGKPPPLRRGPGTTII